MADVFVALQGTPEAATADFECDGTDDHVEINNAIAQAAASGGGTVHIAAGTYSVSSTIAVLEDGVHLQGAGADQTILQASPTFAWIESAGGADLSGVVAFCAVDDFSCRDIGVDAVTNDIHVNGIIAVSDGASAEGDICTNGAIADNAVALIAGAHNYLIWSLRGENIAITGNLVDGNSTVANSDPSQEGIEVWGGDEILVADNIIRNIGGNGLNIGGNGYIADSALSNVVIEDNVIEDSRVGILLFTMHDTYTGDLLDITVSRNQLSGISEYGILLRNFTGDAATPPAVENLIISGNDIETAVLANGAGQPVPAAIALVNSTFVSGQPPATLFSNIQITENTITEADAASLYPLVFLPSTSNADIVMLGVSDFIFAGNQVLAASPQPDSVSIRITHGDSFSIDGNTFDGAGSSSIVVAGASDFEIVNNAFLNWNRGDTDAVGASLNASSSGFEFLNNQFATSVPPAGAIVEKTPILAVGAFSGTTYTSQVDAQLLDEWVDDVILTGAAVVGTGNSRNNTITGNDQANQLDGAAGDDRLIGGAGVDTMSGGGGNDIFHVDDAFDRALEALGDGTDRVYAAVGFALESGQEIETLSADPAAGNASLNLTGNERANNVYGNGGNNVLNGGAHNDTLVGWAGDDTLIGGTGIDTMTGGDGNDSFYVDNAFDRALEALGGGTDRIYAGVSFALEIGREIETLSTDPAAGSASINLTGNELANNVYGNGGSNTLNGGDQNDILVGWAGSDTLVGGTGIDTMTGGDGDDFFQVDSAGDRALEAMGGGTDQVYAAATFALSAGSEIEILSPLDSFSSAPLNLTGNEFANTIFGNAGNNTLCGGAGNDSLSANAGNDTLIGGTGRDTMAGGDGNDIFYADDMFDRALEALGGGTDRVYAGVSFALESGREIETLSTDPAAGSAPLNLTGNELANNVYGNGGNNTLNGGGQNDTLIGWAGSDNFLFNTALNGATNVDLIGDFTVVDDTIQLDDTIFTALAPGMLAAAAFRTGTAAADADDRIIYNDLTGALLYDADGLDGAAATQFALLSISLSITSGDFLVI